MNDSKPSLLKRLRNLLPPTERAMDNRQQEIERRMDDLVHHFYEALEFNRKQLQTSIQTSTAQTRLLLWELMRKEDEDLSATKIRFFHEMPPAEGAMRVLQLANAQLLHDFKLFCEAHNLPFFIVAGTLLGAARHGRAIPWDDDIDVGMLRSDIERLKNVVSEDDRFVVTTIYDQWNCCKQVRFKYSDNTLPCFLDVFYFDYAPDLSEEHDSLYQETRKKLEEAFHAIEQAYINDPGLTGSGDDFKFISGTDPLAQQFCEATDSAVQSLVNANVLCAKEQARYLRWGVENIANGAIPNFPIDDVYPLTTATFEGESYPAPHHVGAVLDEWFGDWLDLPTDMLSHPAHTTLTNASLESLKKFLSD